VQRYLIEAGQKRIFTPRQRWFGGVFVLGPCEAGFRSGHASLQQRELTGLVGFDEGGEFTVARMTVAPDGRGVSRGREIDTEEVKAVARDFQFIQSVPMVGTAQEAAGDRDFDAERQTRGVKE
jgi:hypothetical protein